MKSIKEKAHEIAWEYTKYYDPIVCKQAPIVPKQEWCEMAAQEGANYVIGEIEPIIKADLGSYKSQLDKIKQIIKQLKSNQ